MKSIVRIRGINNNFRIIKHAYASKTDTSIKSKKPRVESYKSLHRALQALRDELLTFERELEL
jgi:hypothetical protein